MHLLKNKVWDPPFYLSMFFYLLVLFCLFLVNFLMLLFMLLFFFLLCCCTPNADKTIGHYFVPTLPGEYPKWVYSSADGWIVKMWKRDRLLILWTNESHFKRVRIYNNKYVFIGGGIQQKAALPYNHIKLT